jgi:hypothetical protein
MAKNTVLSSLPLDYPKTRIMATVGPVNHDYESLQNMLLSGEVDPIEWTGGIVL